MIEELPKATVTDLRRNTEALLERAAHHPILITRYSKPAFVLVSAEHYEALTRTDGEFR